MSSVSWVSLDSVSCLSFKCSQLQLKKGGLCNHGSVETCDLGCRFWDLPYVLEMKEWNLVGRRLLVKCYDNKKATTGSFFLWLRLRWLTNNNKNYSKCYDSQKKFRRCQGTIFFYQTYLDIFKNIKHSNNFKIDKQYICPPQA